MIYDEMVCAGYYGGGKDSCQVCGQKKFIKGFCKRMLFFPRIHMSIKTIFYSGW